MNAIFNLLNPNNTVSVNRHLAHAIGLNEAVVYSALLAKWNWYAERGMLDSGWFWSTAADLEESTALSEKQQKRCLNALVKVGLIRCELRGMPARRCFYIVENIALIERLIADGEAAIAKIKPTAAKRFVCKRQSAASENNAAAQTVQTAVPVTENPNNNAVSPESQNKFRQKVRACSDKRAELLFIKTKDNKPKGNQIYQSYSNQGVSLEEFSRYDMAENNTREEYLQLLKENICYDAICEQNKSDKTRIDELLSIMTDTVCTSKEYVRINGEDMPQQLVKSRFLKLTDEHIDYVLTAMQRNTSNIRNIRAYLLTALYNAPSTMDCYYQAWVNCNNHGMYEKNNLAIAQVLC